MLFIICLIIAIISIVLVFIFERKSYDIASIIAGIVALATSAATVIMLVALLVTYVGRPGVEAKWQEQYASLNTRIEEHIYYPWERGQLIQEVQDWNENLAAHKSAQSNLWVSIFNPESIEGLDKIDLTRIE